MEETEIEALALIAAAIRRSVGVTIGDLQLVAAFAMLEQIRQVRPRRAAKAIKAANKLMSSRRDRSLAAALPAVYVSAFLGQPVCVMVTSDAYAREDSELYQAILNELGQPATITVATPETLVQVQGQQSVIIARLAPKDSKRVSRNLPGSAALPDL
jgi:hypothetical protein